ncbi:MAG: hypothetical protein ACQETK_07845 [Pseudomonadota bacterium]
MRRLLVLADRLLVSLFVVVLAAGAAHVAGTAALVLDGQEYPLAMEVCDFSGESDDRYQTLLARADTDRGPLRVFASRNAVAGMLSHSVSLQVGDVRADGEVLEANRSRMGQQWTSAADGAREPLIRIEGNELVAEDRFVDPKMTRDSVTGHLTASCERW